MVKNTMGIPACMVQRKKLRKPRRPGGGCGAEAKELRHCMSVQRRGGGPMTLFCPPPTLSLQSKERKENERKIKEKKRKEKK